PLARPENATLSFVILEGNPKGSGKLFRSPTQDDGPAGRVAALNFKAPAGSKLLNRGHIFFAGAETLVKFGVGKVALRIARARRDAPAQVIEKFRLIATSQVQRNADFLLRVGGAEQAGVGGSGAMAAG